MESTYRVNVARPDSTRGHSRPVHWFATETTIRDRATELAACFKIAWPDAHVSITYWAVTGIPIQLEG